MSVTGGSRVPSAIEAVTRVKLNAAVCPETFENQVSEHAAVVGLRDIPAGPCSPAPHLTSEALTSEELSHAIGSGEDGSVGMAGYCARYGG